MKERFRRKKKKEINEDAFSAIQNEIETGITPSADEELPDYDDILKDFFEGEPAPEYQLFRTTDIILATFLGFLLGAFAGTYLISTNYRNQGNEQQAQKWLLIGIVTSLILLLVAIFLTPDFSSHAIDGLIWLTTVGAMYYAAKVVVSSRVSEHILRGGKIYPVSRTIVIGLICLLIAFVIYLGVPQAIDTVQGHDSDSEEVVTPKPTKEVPDTTPPAGYSWYNLGNTYFIYPSDWDDISGKTKIEAGYSEAEVDLVSWENWDAGAILTITRVDLKARLSDWSNDTPKKKNDLVNLMWEAGVFTPGLEELVTYAQEEIEIDGQWAFETEFTRNRVVGADGYNLITAKDGAMIVVDFISDKSTWEDMKNVYQQVKRSLSFDRPSLAPDIETTPKPIQTPVATGTPTLTPTPTPVVTGTPAPTPTITGTPTPTPTEEASSYVPEFIISDLTVTPDPVEVSDTVTFVVEVVNLSDGSLDFTLMVKLNGEKIAIKKDFLQARSSRNLRFTKTGLTVGVNQVLVTGYLSTGDVINRLEGEFTVVHDSEIEGDTGSDSPECDTPYCTSNTFNCSSFSTQASAQAMYDYCMSHGCGDVHNLDPDGDGTVCESLP